MRLNAVLTFIEFADSDEIDSILNAAKLRKFYISKGIVDNKQSKKEELSKKQVALIKLLFDSIAEETKKSIGVNIGKFYVIKETRIDLYDRFISRALTILDFMDSSIGRINNDKERYYLFGLLARIYISNLVNSKIPISLLTVINNLDKIPAYVNNEFPGYKESGILNLLIHRERVDFTR